MEHNQYTWFTRKYIGDMTIFDHSGRISTTFAARKQDPKAELLLQACKNKGKKHCFVENLMVFKVTELTQKDVSRKMLLWHVVIFDCAGRSSYVPGAVLPWLRATMDNHGPMSCDLGPHAILAFRIDWDYHRYRKLVMLFGKKGKEYSRKTNNIYYIYIYLFIVFDFGPV